MITEEYTMLGKQPESFLNRVTQALSRPIQSRCAELAVLFDRGTMKDLHTVFPLLVDNIFGPNGTMCWELRSITSSLNAQDFQALQHFLSPLGPMFKLIYALLRDPLLKFEFSLTHLPSKIRQSLSGSAMHPFYVDLVNVNPQTHQMLSLLLNPFDYYFFHFAYHLINPYQQRSHNTGSLSWSTVYYVLCCDYVIHFLPTNPSNPVLPILNLYNGKNPIYMLPSFNKLPKTSKLLRTDVQNFSKIQSLEHHPRNEIWRSETIMTVFIDMWLNNDLVICGSPYFDRSYNSSLSPYQPKFLTNELPSGEYIRIIRVLIKQLHAFASSARADDTHMGELKRIVVPYLQGRMYTFLRHLLHRWPLDGSFRLVLELWLSFIQPWRYTGNEQLKMQEANADLDDMNTNSAPSNVLEVDREYLQFLTENLLAYTVLLQQLLPRFCKMDLASPKMALILYRLTKVFAQPNLVPYLRDIERSAENISNSPVHSYMASSTNNLPPLAITSMWSTNFNNVNPLSTSTPGKDVWNPENTLNGSSFLDSYRLTVGKRDNLIKQKILELEGPNFNYKPIFSTTPAPEVYDLLRQIKNSERTAQQIVQLRLDEMRQQSQGIFGFLKSIFITTESSNDEFTLEERRRVPNYLQLSLSNLQQIFQITDDSDIGQPPLVEDVSANSSSFQNDISHMLTPQKVLERLKCLKYEGDPDLLPVRSDEVKILVRLLYQLALKINQDFGVHICDLYHKENFLGSLSRQILSPPITIYNYDKSFPGRSPRVPQYLPPRISFRYFGSQKFLFYVIIAIILSKLCGYGCMTFLYIAFAFWFMYTCLKAACDRKQTHFVTQNEDAMDVDSFSANDSF